MKTTIILPIILIALFCSGCTSRMDYSPREKVGLTEEQYSLLKENLKKLLSASSGEKAPTEIEVTERYFLVTKNRLVATRGYGLWFGDVENVPEASRIYYDKIGAIELLKRFSRYHVWLRHEDDESVLYRWRTPKLSDAKLFMDYITTLRANAPSKDSIFDE